MKVDLEAVTREALQAWQASPVLRQEFSSEKTYCAYRRAEAIGGVRIFSGGVVQGQRPATHLTFTADPITLDATAGLTLSGAARGHIRGYAAKFGSINRRGSRLVRGAFAAAVARTPIPMLLNHRTDQTIGSFTALVEDQYGLLAVGQINLSVPLGRNAFELLKARDITGLSVGFNVASGGSRIVEGVEEFTAVDLLEISVTPTPAEDLARVTSVEGA